MKEGTVIPDTLTETNFDKIGIYNELFFVLKLF